MLSIGSTPLHTISALDEAALGNIRPGQSQSWRNNCILHSNKLYTIISFYRKMVWKCLVFPGLLATPTSFLLHRVLMTELFPTFG